MNLTQTNARRHRYFRVGSNASGASGAAAAAQREMESELELFVGRMSNDLQMNGKV